MKLRKRKLRNLIKEEEEKLKSYKSTPREIQRAKNIINDRLDGARQSNKPELAEKLLSILNDLNSNSINHREAITRFVKCGGINDYKSRS